MRTGDAEHLRKIKELEAILGPISRPNYHELSAFETERHCTAGAITSGVLYHQDDELYRAAELSDRVTARMLKDLDKIR